MSLTDVGKNFYMQIKPCFDEACEVLNNLNIGKNNEKDFFIKIDGFYYPQIQNNIHKFLLENEGVNLNLSCEVVLDIASELIYGESDIIISPLNLQITDNRIQKISLPTERIGIIMNKSLIEKYRGNLNKALQNEKLIDTKNVLEHSIFVSLMKKLKPYKFTKKIMSMSEMDTLFLLGKGIGFTLATECFARFYTKQNDQIYFIKRPLEQDLFLNRSAYILASNVKNSQDMLNKLIKHQEK